MTTNVTGPKRSSSDRARQADLFVRGEIGELLAALLEMMVDFDELEGEVVGATSPIALNARESFNRNVQQALENVRALAHARRVAADRAADGGNLPVFGGSKRLKPFVSEELAMEHFQNAVVPRTASGVKRSRKAAGGR